MLTANLPIMKTNLNLLLTPSKGNPFYDAAYDAAYDARYCEGERDFNDADDKLNDPNFDKDIKASIEANSNYIQRENDLKNKSNKFAADFAKGFCESLKNGKFMDSLADEVNNHIKSMGLLITMLPQGLVTITSPVGPCTGSMIISDSTAQIQIL